jgi:4-hydroxy-tetrahydrodipicolinate synthase
MISGVWVPLITPFKDGRIDLASYRRLIEHTIAAGVSGLFPLGTTGEAPTLDEAETDAIIAETVDVVAGRLPVFVGIGGNATHKVIKTIARLERHGFPGIVSVCPYYNRPSQDGLRAHFTAISEATDREILLYNIPYRTSVNLANQTVLRLAELANVVGIKDSAGNIAQSLELVANKPPTDRFAEIARLVAANNHRDARTIWSPLQQLIAKLFEEANPMPLKYCLWRQGLIASPECRLPLTSISGRLRDELDRWLQEDSLIAASDRDGSSRY